MKSYPFSGAFNVNQLADELVAAGVPMGGESRIDRNGFPIATQITIWAQDSAVDATVNSVVAAHVPGGAITGAQGPPGPAPSGTGVVKVASGVLQTPGAIQPSDVAGTAIVEGDARLTNARAPSGAAGGVLAGTYPNPTIGANVTVTGSLGYAGGAGGTVTQLTSKSTGVTLNKVCGQITTHNASLAAGAEVSFVVTDSVVAATDVVVLCIGSGGTAGAYLVTVGAVSAGSFRVVLSNASAGALAEALVLNVLVLKGVAA